MMIQELLSKIRNLNDGAVIPSLEDSKAFHDLKSEKVLLYKDQHGKYYYFSEYQIDSQTDILGEIERIALDPGKYEIIPKPRDRYLILLFKVEMINEVVYKKVIELEENEFLFKKYVFYYTENEWDDFSKWLEDMQKKRVEGIEPLLSEDSLSKELNSPGIQFFLRLLIKMPFLPLPVKAVGMKDFQTILDKNLRNKPELIEMKKSLFQALDDCSGNPEAAAGLLYKQMMEE